MKPITAAAAIDLGIVTPETMYSTDRYDRRYFMLPGDAHGWDPRISVRKAIVKSSNIVIGKLGVDIGPRRLWGYMKKFGFGERTGIELPGEEKGQFPHWKVWDKVKWSRAPIGQGVNVTAIQMASAYQAIANDGLRMQPRIVRKVVGADGKVLIDNTPKPLDRPISAKTARIMRDVMKDVATHKGTAHRAAIRGYTTAGKTGTAQKVINGIYSKTLYVATFCGIIPADDPRLVILVSLDFDRPAARHQGGNSSAPVYRRIASAATRYLMIPADKPEEFEDFDEEDEYDRILDERAKKQEKAVAD
jgi:cell division protein FtsI (penicillin-binding protein 3)